MYCQQLLFSFDAINTHSLNCYVLTAGLGRYAYFIKPDIPLKIK